MCVASRVLLRLKESIKIPEAALDIIVCRHLCEPAQNNGSITLVNNDIRKMTFLQKKIVLSATATHPISRKI